MKTTLKMKKTQKWKWPQNCRPIWMTPKWRQPQKQKLPLICGQPQGWPKNEDNAPYEDNPINEDVWKINCSWTTLNSPIIIIIWWLMMSEWIVTSQPPNSWILINIMSGMLLCFTLTTKIIPRNGLLMGWLMARCF